MKTETGEMHLQGKDYQTWPRSTSSHQRGTEQVLLVAFRGTNPATSCISAIQPAEPRQRMPFVWAPGQWCFVRAQTNTHPKPHRQSWLIILYIQYGMAARRMLTYYLSLPNFLRFAVFHYTVWRLFVLISASGVATQNVSAAKGPRARWDDPNFFFLLKTCQAFIHRTLQLNRDEVQISLKRTNMF